MFDECVFFAKEFQNFVAGVNRKYNSNTKSLTLFSPKLIGIKLTSEVWCLFLPSDEFVDQLVSYLASDN